MVSAGPCGDVPAVSVDQLPEPLEGGHVPRAMIRRNTMVIAQGVSRVKASQDTRTQETVLSHVTATLAML